MPPLPHAPQLSEVRQRLEAARTDPGAAAFFRVLYRSWVLSASAAISLCLLAGAHALARELVAACARPPAGLRPGCVVELCALAPLLEAPAAAGLRLALLEPRRNADLLRRAAATALPLSPPPLAFQRGQCVPHAVPKITLVIRRPPALHLAPAACCPLNKVLRSRRASRAPHPLPHDPDPPAPAPRRALYGLLMLLPQGDAFSLLSRRLTAVPLQALLALEPGSIGSDGVAAPQAGGSAQRESVECQQGRLADESALLALFEGRQVRI